MKPTLPKTASLAVAVVAAALVATPASAATDTDIANDKPHPDSLLWTPGDIKHLWAANGGTSKGTGETSSSKTGDRGDDAWKDLIQSLAPDSTETSTDNKPKSGNPQ